MNEEANHHNGNERNEREHPPGSSARSRRLFLGAAGLNKYAIAGILAITLGTLLMTGLTQHPRLIIFGGVTNGIGLLMVTVGSFVSSKKDKSEVIDRITRFREELIGVRNTLVPFL